jgi:hypothetical protein
MAFVPARLTRKLVLVGAAAAALVAGGVGYAVAADPPTDLHLMVSTQANRSGAVEMVTGRLSGRVAIFLKADSPVREVRFFLDDPSRTRAPRLVDGSAPYDFAGASPDGSAVLFDTASLPSGRHVFSAQVIRPNGGSRMINKTMTIANGVPQPTPTATAAPSPTSPRPTPPTTTAPPPPSPSNPAGYPNERNTGVPPGTTLRPSGSLTITVPGTVIDGYDITGTVTVRASNVTVKRSRISAGGGLYPIRVTSGNVVVEDSEITGGTSAAVCCGNFVLRRVNIHDIVEGPRMGSNSTIEFSYLHHLQRCAGCHIDALQSTGGTGIRIRGNNIQVYNPVLRDPMNAAFQFGEEQAPVRDCLVEGNLMNGGNYTVNGGGGGTRGAQCTFRANKFQRDFRYGPAGNLFGGVTWESSNVWFDNGQPVR